MLQFALVCCNTYVTMAYRISDKSITLTGNIVSLRPVTSRQTVLDKIMCAVLIKYISFHAIETFAKSSDIEIPFLHFANPNPN